MNNYVISEIDSAQKKMGAYVALLNYRYMNLCVKAELGALMPVTVFVGNEPHNIEEVANINSPDEYQFGIYPINENNLQDIIHGIYEAHPEFKMELKNNDGNDGGSPAPYLLYTMPDVDKNRHDFLENAIKGLHEECCTRLDAIRLEYKVRLVENLQKISQADTDEALKALDDVHRQSLEMADGQLYQKQTEIDEALSRYELKSLQQDDDPDFDYTKGMRMYQPETE